MVKAFKTINGKRRKKRKGERVVVVKNSINSAIVTSLSTNILQGFSR